MQLIRSDTARGGQYFDNAQLQAAIEHLEK
jgi:hypothetical protein